MTTRRCALPFAVIALLAIGCGGDDDDDGGGDGAPTIDAAAVIDATPPAPDAAALGAQCFPVGIYGKCVESGCPNCLDGAGFYQSCTSSCTETSECGDAADFDGAQPLCAPLNPGAMQMICVLTCTANEQCPCGLPCIASGAGVNICANPTT